MKKISIRSVVDAGVCVGCGACSIATQGQIKIATNEFGFYQAHLDAVAPKFWVINTGDDPTYSRVLFYRKCW